MDEESGWFSNEAATFGDRLAGARENAGLTQAELARRIGVETSVIVSWEDDVKEPRANRLQMLSGMLGVSLSWLLNGEGEGPVGPADPDAIRSDLSNLMGELRALRVQISRSGDQLAQLEKRLRSALKENA